MKLEIDLTEGSKVSREAFLVDRNQQICLGFTIDTDRVRFIVEVGKKKTDIVVDSTIAKTGK